MQNRLVLTGIPSIISSLPNSRESLRDLVEENGCWVDRFAFLTSNSNHKIGTTEEISQEVALPPVPRRRNHKTHATKRENTIVAVAELHIENVRDKAVRSLDMMHIKLDSRGNLHSNYNSGSTHPSLDDPDFIQKDEIDCEGDDTMYSFTIRAWPATMAQSRLLIESCPINYDLDEEKESNSIMDSQVLALHNGVTFTIKKSDDGGGTGENAWRGGLILAQHISLWIEEQTNSTFEGASQYLMMSDNVVTGKDLFDNKRVLELGAGSAGLPSMTLAKCCERFCVPLKLVATDGIDEIVQALKRNVAINHLDEKIHVEHLDWNHLPPKTLDARVEDNIMCADTIIFADCVYNEEGAVALSNAIDRLLTSKGHVIGVLPDFRVGLDCFEKLMVDKSFIATDIPRIKGIEASNLSSSNGTAFLCSGGGGKDYRLLHWYRKRETVDKSTYYC